MAERRMFAKSIVLSDAFLDMPTSTRCLYFTLSMFSDDDGFCGSPKAIMRQCGATEDDMKLLLTKRFILDFESGVIVIKHWRINNYLQSDRHKKTTYVEELNTLALDEKGAYVEKPMYTECIQNVYTGKDSIGKDSIGKDSIDNNTIECAASTDAPMPKQSKKKHGFYNHVLLTDTELGTLYKEFGDKETEEAIKFLDEYIEMKGYKAKSHYLCIRKWVFDAVKERKRKGTNGVTKSAQNYNQYQQHEYSSDDLKEIERQLLGVGK